MTCLNLATTLRTSARKYPDKSALVIGETNITYAKLDAMARIFAGAIDALAGVSQRALMLPNVPQFTATYYGALYRGSVVVPLNVLFKSEEVSYHLTNSDAEVLVVWEGFLEHAKTGFEKVESCRHLIVVPQSPTNIDSFAGDDSISSSDSNVHNFNVLMKDTKTPRTELASTSPDDTAVILYTSGTTGKPKGAELSHFNMFQNAQHLCTRLLPLKSDDVLLAVLPLFHSFGQTCVQNSGMMLGCTIVLQPRFEPVATFQLMQKHQVSFFAGVPTMYVALLHHPDGDKYNIDSLRFCVSGGSSLPTEVMHQFDSKYNVNILEGYGLSETSPIASFNVLDNPKVSGSIGIPLEFVEFRLVDKEGNTVEDSGTPGEIMVKGPNVMKGYYKDSEATQKVIDENGWFATGDIATVNSNGYYTIVDRKKDMVIRGGFNVYSCEVEEVLYQQKAIKEAAVIGIKDKVYGEEVKAVVALKPGEHATESEIIEFCKSKLAAYKYPRVVEITESLPKGPTGKILKRELRRANAA